jgi:hypothetical protein
MKGNKSLINIFVILFLLFFTGSILDARADWTISLTVTLNGSGQLPLVLGKKAGATDNFDTGVDQLAAPQTPEGDSYYFRSITGDAAPRNNLLEDYRATNFSQAAWRLALTAADTKTYVVSWNAASLPAG